MSDFIRQLLDLFKFTKEDLVQMELSLVVKFEFQPSLERINQKLPQHLLHHMVPPLLPPHTHIRPLLHIHQLVLVDSQVAISILKGPINGLV